MKTTLLILIACLLGALAFANDGTSTARLAFGMNIGYDGRSPLIIIPIEGELSGCMLQGEASPDFGLQRINVKFSTASCVDKKEARLYEIDGYLFGSDGTPGIEAIHKRPSKEVMRVVKTYEEMNKKIFSTMGEDAAAFQKQILNLEIIKLGHLEVEKDTIVRLFVKSKLIQARPINDIGQAL